MKYIVTFLCLAIAAAASAVARLSVDALPGPVRPLAEAETNVVFSAGARGDNLWKLSIELESSVSNCVEVVFGTDANNDGVLGVGEGELCVGWDCGEWFWLSGWTPTVRHAPSAETSFPVRLRRHASTPTGTSPALFRAERRACAWKARSRWTRLN